MQTRSKLFDDLSKLMTNAAGVAQGMREEAETMVRGRLERFIADADLVTREEFEAARDMAQKAREENAGLHAELGALRAEIAALAERLHAVEKKRAPKAADKAADD